MTSAGQVNTRPSAPEISLAKRSSAWPAGGRVAPKIQHYPTN
jgi:hypothetical protein